MKKSMDAYIAPIPPFAQSFVIPTVLTVTETQYVAFLRRIKRKALVLLDLACRTGWDTRQYLS